MQILPDKSQADRLQMQIVAAESARRHRENADRVWRLAPRSRHIIFCSATVRSRSRPRGGTSLACPACCRRAAITTRSINVRWQVPAQFNIGVAVCDCFAAREPGKLAIVAVDADGTAHDVSYGWLRDTSNRLANALAAHGIAPGHRVAILLPQAPEVAAIHIAVYKLGAIALPLAMLFGTEAISYRLRNSGAKALITNAHGLAKVARGELPGLQLVLSVDGPGDGALGFQQTLERASADFTPRLTRADDPAMMIYTSGTTGPPKGALHAHRVLLGHMPGIEMPHDFFPQPGDRFWTPADWAWAGGLLDCLCRVSTAACRWSRAGSTSSIPMTLMR